MRRFLYVILVIILPLIGKAEELIFPEYNITDVQFQHALDSAYLHTQMPDFIGKNWIAYGHLYLTADYGWNGKRRPPVIDTTTWNLSLSCDEGICRNIAGAFDGAVDLHGHWILLDSWLLMSGFFTPTGKTCKVLLCNDAEDEFYPCECLHDDVPCLINYSMPAVQGVPTKDFMVLGKPIWEGLNERDVKDSIYTEADVMPMYIAGEDSLQRYIDSRRKVFLEEGEQSSGIYEVKVAIVVERNGIPRYARVKESCGNRRVDKAAVRMFCSDNSLWHPGLINCEPVCVEVYRTVIFDRPAKDISTTIKNY